MTTASDLLALGPDALYLFDETSGTTLVDSSGNGRDGTYSGGVTLGEPGLTPDSTAAASFDGVDGFASVAYDAAWMAQSTYSVVATVLVPEATAYATFAVIPNVWELYYDDDTTTAGLIGFTTSTVEGGKSLASSAYDAVPTGVPVRVAGTYDGSFIRLYLDGALVDSVAHAGTVVTPTGDDLTFASYPGWGETHPCTLDEIAVFSSVLSDAEIAALGPAVPPTPPPRNGLGLVLDSGGVVDVVPPLDAGTPGGSSTALNIVAPTVPVPTLVNGRPT